MHIVIFVHYIVFQAEFWCVQHRRTRLFGFIRAHRGGGGGRQRERELCSFSWLRVASENFPSSPPLPAPTVCLHYSRVFQATPMTARNKWLADPDRSTSVCAVAVHDARPPPSLTVGTVCGGLRVHALFVHGAGSERGVGRAGLAP